MGILIFIILFIVVNSVLGGPINDGLSYLLDRDTGPPKTNWFEVEDWEVRVCVDHGGLGSPETSGETMLDNYNYENTTQRIITLQAQITDNTPTFNEDQIIESSKLYERSSQ